MLRIGTAGWSIGRNHAAHFEAGDSHLIRYASRLNAAEINSSFHRPHRPTTYARWASDTPEGFAFSVKLPRTITHDARLKDAGTLLQQFLIECGTLGDKLGCILIQLPPSLEFENSVTRDFLKTFRTLYPGAAALEPRHPGWFTKKSDAMLARFKIARVAADPLPAKMKDLHVAAEPGGFEGLHYWRLHGSPKVYYSSYDDAFLRKLTRRLLKEGKTKEAWCIFDNTTLGAAIPNALFLSERVS